MDPTSVSQQANQKLAQLHRQYLKKDISHQQLREQRRKIIEEFTSARQQVTEEVTQAIGRWPKA